MFLTPEDVTFLIRNGLWILSLLICLILLFWPAFRRPSNPLAWLVWGNLVAGAVWYGQFPLAEWRKDRFIAADPGYAAAAQPFDGRSLYIPDPRPMRQAAYSCWGSYSATLCEMPVADMLRRGALDFVEMGTGPIWRYSIAVHDPRCVDWSTRPSGDFSTEPFVLTDDQISPGLAACVVRDEVESVTATHEIVLDRRPFPWPSRTRYYHVELRDRATDSVLDQFDGWYGADPYLRFSQPDNARRPTTGPLADLLMIHAARNGYDRALDDRYLTEYGINEDLLRAAVTSPYQTYKAHAIWLACRDELQASLSPETLAILTAASAGLFPNNPAWRYPEDCREWAR